MRYFTGHPASKTATEIRSKLYDAIELVKHDWLWSSDEKRHNWIDKLQEVIKDLNSES